MHRLLWVLLAACSPVRTAVDEAADMERARCGPDVGEPTLAPVLENRGNIDSVAPLYVDVPDGKSGGGTRLDGALVRIRPIPGMTAEWLDRALECHSARRVLGRIPSDALPNDPFWLPGRTVDIDAESARDGFQVAVRGSSVDDNKEILSRATAFAGH